MIFALGFLSAGLLTLLFLPAFWRRAVRLSTRRLETQMPLTMSEIVTERDQLRASFATEQRRLEQKIEDIAEQRAHDLGELGRRTTRIAALEADLVGRGVDDDLAALVADRHLAPLSPIDDVRSSAGYRRRAVPVLLGSRPPRSKLAVRSR